MKHVIIVNPISGKERGYKYARTIKNILLKNNINPQIIQSQHVGEITTICSDLAMQEKTRFYCIGGDGTLNEIISGIIYTDSEVVVYPCGTGNDFAKYINDYRSVRKITISSLELNSSKYDTIKLSNGKYCVNILNAGFDALVASNLKYFRKVPLISGKSKYNLSILYTLFTNRNYNLKIRTNAFIEKGKYTLIAISNGKCYGGGIIPSPNSNANDGKLSICKIYSTSILKKIILLPKYKNCKHENLSLAYINDDIYSISIVSNKKFPLSIDGEIIFTNKIKANIVPKCVNIISCKKSSTSK